MYTNIEQEILSHKMNYNLHGISVWRRVKDRKLSYSGTDKNTHKQNKTATSKYLLFTVLLDRKTK